MSKVLMYVRSIANTIANIAIANVHLMLSSSLWQWVSVCVWLNPMFVFSSYNPSFPSLFHYILSVYSVIDSLSSMSWSRVSSVWVTLGSTFIWWVRPNDTVCFHSALSSTSVSVLIEIDLLKHSVLNLWVWGENENSWMGNFCTRCVCVCVCVMNEDWKILVSCTKCAWWLLP